MDHTRHLRLRDQVAKALQDSLIDVMYVLDLISKLAHIIIPGQLKDLTWHERQY